MMLNGTRVALMLWLASHCHGSSCGKDMGISTYINAIFSVHQIRDCEWAFRKTSWFVVAYGEPGLYRTVRLEKLMSVCFLIFVKCSLR